MLNKINNWDSLESSEVVSGGGLPVGIYPVKIVKVEDISDKEYLKITFDVLGVYENGKVLKKPEVVNYFSKNLFEGKWSSQGITYRSYKDTASRFFRAFITAIEKSNKNYIWDWDEQSLVDKYFVAVFGEEEYEDANGDVKVSTKCVDCRSIEAMNNGDLKVPALKKLKKKAENENTNNDLFGNLKINDISDEDLPF